MSDEKNPDKTEETKKDVEPKKEEITSNEKPEEKSTESTETKKEEPKEEVKSEEPKTEAKEEPKKEETSDKKSSEYKTVDGPKKSDVKKSSKPKKPLGKRILHFIVGFIIYLVIVAVISAIYFLWEKSNKVSEDSTNESKAEVTWGDTYIKILEDEDNFKNLKDVEIALCDIGQDGTPELIVYGTKSDGKNSANIYNINKNGEVDTVKFELKDEFNTEFLYDSSDDEYKWYIVTENDDLYEINLDEDDYNVEKSDEVYDDYEVVETSEKTPYEVGTDDPTEIFDDAEKVYTSSEDLKSEYSDSSKTDKKPTSSKKNTKATEALDAYKEALETTDFGKEFDMYLNYTDASEGYDTFVGEYIFLTDLDGDEIPELFYVGGFKNMPYGDGTIEMRYKNGKLDMSLNEEVYILGIFKNLQGDGYFAQISTSPQWDSKGYHIIDLTDNTEFIVELNLDSTGTEDAYYRFDFTDVGNLQNYYNEVDNKTYSNNYQTINETQYNDYCAQYVGENSYSASSAYVEEDKGTGILVTTDFDASSLDKSQIEDKFEEAVDNYNDLCDTLAK